MWIDMKAASDEIMKLSIKVLLKENVNTIEELKDEHPNSPRLADD